MKSVTSGRQQKPEGIIQQPFVEIDYAEIKRVEVRILFANNIHKPICIYFIFFFLQFLGQGGFGMVYKAIWRDSFVAVKHITRDTEENAFKIEVQFILNNKLKVFV